MASNIWDRRALLAALGVAPALPAFAQTPGAAPESAAEARLLANLVTRMAARVGLNGRRRFVFVIDTGAGRTAVSDRVAAELSLPRGPDVLVHGVTSAEVTPTVRVANLEFGDRRFSELDCPVFPADQLAADGLVGLDVLSRFRLTFDLGRHRVTLAPSGGNVIEFSQTFQEASRLSRQGGSTAVARFGQLVLIDNAWADDLPISLFVDSGAQYSVGNPALRDLIDLYYPPQTARERIQIFGVIGQSVQAEIGGVRNLRIGRGELGPTPLMFADLHAFRALDLTDRPTLLLGADILSRYREVRLDYGRGTMSFSGLRPARRFAGYAEG